MYGIKLKATKHRIQNILNKNWSGNQFNQSGSSD